MKDQIKSESMDLLSESDVRVSPEGGASSSEGGANYEEGVARDEADDEAFCTDRGDNSLVDEKPCESIRLLDKILEDATDNKPVSCVYDADIFSCDFRILL